MAHSQSWTAKDICERMSVNGWMEPCSHLHRRNSISIDGLAGSSEARRLAQTNMEWPGMGAVEEIVVS